MCKHKTLVLIRPDVVEYKRSSQGIGVSKSVHYSSAVHTIGLYALIKQPEK